MELVASCDNKAISIQPSKFIWDPALPTRSFIYVAASEAINSAKISFSIATGGSYVAGLVGQLSVSAKPLALVVLGSPPATLYIGSKNAQNTTVTIPAGVALKVAVAIDGDDQSISVSPSTLVWEASSARTASLTFVGVYGSSRLNRVRLLITDGPTSVAVAPSDDAAGIVVTDLRIVARSPSADSFSLVEGESLTVVFSPAEEYTPVQCHCEDANVNVTNNGSHTVVQTLRYGDYVVSCSVSDMRYASPKPFSLTVAKKKTLSITATSLSPIVETFVGVSAPVIFSVSRGPSEGHTFSIIIDSASVKSFAFVSQEQVAFSRSTSGVATQSITILGVNITNGFAFIPLRFAGCANEYDLTLVPYIRLIVREKITLKVVPAGALVLPNASEVLYAYVGESNAVTVSLALSNSTVFGAVTIIASKTSASIECAPQTMVLNTPNPQYLSFYSKTFGGPFQIGFDVADYPREYVGIVKSTLARIIFKPLETITVGALASVLLKDNVATLSVKLSGAPSPSQRVRVKISYDNAYVEIVPTVLEWLGSVSGTSLTQYFSISGLSLAKNTTVTVSIDASASNFGVFSPVTTRLPRL